MMTAMDLEKGAYRYYHQVLAMVGEAAFRPTIETLARAEEAHARMIHALWRRERPQAEDFETLFAQLPGEILESGQPLAEALAHLAAVKAPNCLGLMELSLEIEYRAYDLYRTMATRAADARERDSFNAIAQAEKQHMRVLTRALPQCG
jgi:rubrerythrin